MKQIPVGFITTENQTEGTRTPVCAYCHNSCSFPIEIPTAYTDFDTMNVSAEMVELICPAFSNVNCPLK